MWVTTTFRRRTFGASSLPTLRDSSGYTRKRGRPHAGSASKKAAQKSRYYDRHVEKTLADEVESPTNLLMDKICRGESLDMTERTKVAIYMGCMLKRVPRHRRKSRESYPGVLAETVAKTKRAIEEAARELVNVSRERVALRLTEAEVA